MQNAKNILFSRSLRHIFPRTLHAQSTHIKQGNVLRFYSTTEESAQESQSNEKSSEETSFITREFYTLPKQELEMRFYNELKPLMVKIINEHGVELDDFWGFELGTKELKFRVLRFAMRKFGRDIPSCDVPKLNRVSEVIQWYIDSIEKEKAIPTLKVPENVSLFIKEKESQRKLRQLELQMTPLKSLRKKIKKYEQKV